MLFVDKTGTLTKGAFEPTVFISGGLDSYESFGSIPPPLANLLSFAIIQSTSSKYNPKTLQVLGGNSSDRALLTLVAPHALMSTASINPEIQFVNSIVFNSTRKFSATQILISDNLHGHYPTLNTGRHSNGSMVTLVKGAPEVLLPFCTTYYASNGSVVSINSILSVEREINLVSSNGVRVILIATSNKPLQPVLPAGGGSVTGGSPPVDLTLVGIVGITDGLRNNVSDAIELCRIGGIQVVMITGDKKETATAVAKQIGLIADHDLSQENEGQGFEQVAVDLRSPGVVLTSSQFNSMNDQQISSILPQLRVLARALPTDKSRLVKIAQQEGHVVGMTGDGVNDSAALRSADVGFAMGSGAEVAKEASDIVILDDNFASITQAVLYGRTIYRSIRKFIVFQSTVNLASTVIVFLGPFLGFDFPLSLIQLLWVNLVMDTLAALAYGGEPALQQYMRSKPTPRDSPIISTYMWTAIIANGLFISILSIYFLIGSTIQPYFREPEAATTTTTLSSTTTTTTTAAANSTPISPFLTGFFSFFIFITNFNSFNVRTKKLNLFSNIFGNWNFVLVVLTIFGVQILFTEIGGNVLRTVGLTLSEWGVVVGLAVTVIPFDILRKIFIVPRVRALKKRKYKL
eukprot:TRINITY_DN488_c1_g1_i6.p1 TRINITY_DN488_c1_g1~~TRINITY_DN488_c1_g1_i6.p1  ORF type:complete len:633 (-),score=168.15 TRINITY_DN488_c1_g1_i6:126-2024(-)